MTYKKAKYPLTGFSLSMTTRDLLKLAADQTPYLYSELKQQFEEGNLSFVNGVYLSESHSKK